MNKTVNLYYKTATFLICVCSSTLYILSLDLIPLSNTSDAILEQQFLIFTVQRQSTVVHGVNSLLKKHVITHDSVQENDENSCCWPCNVRFLTTEMLLAAR